MEFRSFSAPPPNKNLTNSNAKSTRPISGATVYRLQSRSYGAIVAPSSRTGNEFTRNDQQRQSEFTSGVGPYAPAHHPPLISSRGLVSGVRAFPPRLHDERRASARGNRVARRDLEQRREKKLSSARLPRSLDSTVARKRKEGVGISPFSCCEKLVSCRRRRQDARESFLRASAKVASLARLSCARNSSSRFPLLPVHFSYRVNILQIVLYLTTILTTINRQQKSVLPQRTCKKCATQPASTSGDASDASRLLAF